MSPAQPTSERNTESDADAADNEAKLSRHTGPEWVLLGLIVAAGLVTLVGWLLITLSLTLLLWLPAALLAGVLIAAAWRWS